MIAARMPRDLRPAICGGLQSEESYPEWYWTSNTLTKQQILKQRGYNLASLAPLSRVNKKSNVLTCASPELFF
jgi:hypothetical protein